MKSVLKNYMYIKKIIMIPNDKIKAGKIPLTARGLQPYNFTNIFSVFETV